MFCTPHRPDPFEGFVDAKINGDNISGSVTVNSMYASVPFHGKTAPVEFLIASGANEPRG